jgi:hypothetical protein
MINTLQSIKRKIKTNFTVATVSSLLLTGAASIAFFDANDNANLPQTSTAKVSVVTTRTQSESETAQVPQIGDDGIPITIERNAPVDGYSISKNPEVVLTDKQTDVVQAFADYLASKNEWAIVTSGKRTSESQLDIIKQRIEEKGAEKKFPKLEDADVGDTKIWLAAWKWLRARRVPVNAPAAVPGANVSQHLTGHAIDFISDDLDHLRSLVSGFMKSKFAKQADYRISAIVREPGCVHINVS